MFDLAILWVFTLSTSLIAAICLFDLYRYQNTQSRVEKELEKEDLELICNLAKVVI